MGGFGQPLELAARSFVLDSPEPLYESPPSTGGLDTYQPTGNARRMVPLVNVGEYANLIIALQPSIAWPFYVEDLGCLAVELRWKQKPSGNITNLGQVFDLWGWGPSAPDGTVFIAVPILFPYLEIWGTWVTAAGGLDGAIKQAAVNLWGTNRNVPRRFGREHDALLTVENPILPPGISYFRLPDYSGPAYISQWFGSVALTFEGNEINPATAFPPVAPDGRWLRDYTLPVAGGDLSPRKVVLSQRRSYLRVNNPTAGPVYCTFNLRIGEPTP